jgi:acyl-coenzyme A thioesterase PaaI-like protein
MTRDTGRVLCEAEVVHRGSRVATAEGRVLVEETGKLIAHATTTCIVMDAPTSGGAAGAQDSSSVAG